MNIVILSILIFCLTQLRGLQATIELTENYYGGIKHEYPFEVFRFKGDRLTRAACKNENRKVHCKIEQLAIPSENITYSCEVELPEKLKDHKDAYLSFQAFGKDKLIIAEPVSRAVMLYTVHLAECRVSNGYRLPDGENLPSSFVGKVEYELGYNNRIVAYKNAYDVFYHNYTCSIYKICKVRIDAEGKLIEGPVEFDEITNMYSIHSIAVESEGLVYGKSVGPTYEWSTVLMAALPDGTKKQIAHLQPVRIRVPQIFTNDELIGAWFWKGGNNYTLIQADSLGNIKLQADFEKNERPRHDGSVYLPFIYNLPKGGFILFEMRATLSKVIDNHIVKIDAAGKTIGKINFEMPNCIKELEKQPPVHMWRNEEGHEYCAALVGKCFENDKSFKKLIVKCFTDNDFL